MQLRKQLKYSWKSFPKRNKLDHYAINKDTLTTEWAMKIEDNIFVFIMDVEVNTHQIEQDVKKLCDIDVAKVNTIISTDGERRALCYTGSWL